MPSWNFTGDSVTFWEASATGSRIRLCRIPERTPAPEAAPRWSARPRVRAGHTIRTVTYTDYVNEDGMILNGTESTDTTASQASIRYVADITVTGTHTGYLEGDVIINKLTRTITSTDPNNPTPITSSLDGDTQILWTPTTSRRLRRTCSRQQRKSASR
jgi:hypothetical protein